MPAAMIHLLTARDYDPSGDARWLLGSIAPDHAFDRAYKDAIHLRALPKKTAVWSAVGFVFGSLALMWIFRALGDGVSELDATATALSVIATWWLTRSYIQQWMLWVVANTLTTALCIVNGQYWMAVLYLAYIASAVYGYFHWKKKGVEV